MGIVRMDNPSGYVQQAKPEQTSGAQEFGSSLFGIPNSEFRHGLSFYREEVDSTCCLPGQQIELTFCPRPSNPSHRKNQIEK